MKKQVKWGGIALLLVFAVMLTGCVSAPKEGLVRMEFGGTLPPEILAYFTEDELKDIEAKFIVVQGEIPTLSLFSSTLNTAILVTVGKDYRIAQMSRYIKPAPEAGIPAGQHQKLTTVDIVPNMVTKYNSLQGVNSTMTELI